MPYECFSKVKGQLVTDRANQNPGVEQFIVCFPKRMGKDAPVAAQIDFIGTIILGTEKVFRDVT